MPSCPSLQGLALVAAQLDLDGRSTTTCHGCSFCQGFYLTERAPAMEIPDSQDFSAKQADSTLGRHSFSGAMLSGSPSIPPRIDCPLSVVRLLPCLSSALGVPGKALTLRWPLKAGALPCST